MKLFQLWLYVSFSSVIFLSDINDAKQTYQLLKHLSSPIKEKLSTYFYDSSFISAKFYSTIHVSSQDGLMEADKIAKLPGQPKVNFNQYGGYVTVDQKNGRALYYYFVESQQNSSTKPLLLWLNGGPGCSSLGFGAMLENGPFRVDGNGRTLFRSNNSWNIVANVLYLDSPVGTGFSYSNTTLDYHNVTDERTAIDSFTFLINWFERFPHYKTRGFFIAGESYAGHTITQLAQIILRSNKHNRRATINLHGIAIGDAYIDNKSVQEGFYEFAWSHALISNHVYYSIKENCKFPNGDIDNTKCENSISEAQIGFVNTYNIYDPWNPNCDGPNSTYRYCSSDNVITYLNTPKIQMALHANITKLSYAWKLCSDPPTLTYAGYPSTVMPIVKELIGDGINIWLYSGDVDDVVSTAATRHAIRMLNLPVINRWHPWYCGKEVGGYIEEYKGITLVTIRGAGHMAPTDQPERALAMISSFLTRKSLPESKMT